MATNYGSTLGLGTIGMILALLVTQIVAVPFSILFGHWGRKFGALKLIKDLVGIVGRSTFIGPMLLYRVYFYFGYLQFHNSSLLKAVGRKPTAYF